MRRRFRPSRECVMMRTKVLEVRAVQHLRYWGSPEEEEDGPHTLKGDKSKHTSLGSCRTYPWGCSKD